MTRGMIKTLAVILCMGLGIVGGYYALKEVRFNRDAPQANFKAPQDMQEARTQDLEQFELFFSHEQSWTQANLKRAKQAWSDLKRTAGSLSDAQFELEIARIVAMADNAHTKIREYNRTPRYNRLPIRTHVFADGVFVIRAYKGFEDLLGLEVASIEGRSINEVLANLQTYIAGPSGTQHKYAPYLFESPELMFAAGLAKAPDQMQITFKDRATVRERTMASPFPSSSDHIARSHVLLAPKTYAQSQPDWKRLHTNPTTPHYLRTPLKKLQTVQIPELDATYIQFWTNNDTSNISLTDFCESAIQTYTENRTGLLILDHRFNSGGNFQKTKSHMENLAALVPEDGRMYVVTGGATFSAGIYSAAFAKYYAGYKAVLIGERVGDRLQSWGEDNLLRLPNSEIEIKFATGMHDLKAGCNDWSRCYWEAMFLDLRIDNLDPEIPAPLTFADYLQQRDPVLEAIARAEGLVTLSSKVEPDNPVH